MEDAHASMRTYLMLGFRFAERGLPMSENAEIFLNGFARPLSAWSERALAQTWNDLQATLAGETRAAGRIMLMESIAALEAERDRRGGALSPERVEELGKRGQLTPTVGQRAKARNVEPRARDAAKDRSPERARDVDRRADDTRERQHGGRERD